MKKLFFLILAIVSLQFATFAQTKPAAAKPATKAATAKPAKAAKDSAGVVLKKDGTPDKRYNKPATDHVKKDGTPDKRFKENKKKEKTQ